MAIVRDFKIGLIMLDFISIRMAKCETLAKYCNHKHCRWLSGDPALGEYVLSPGTEPSKLAGMGGVYNTINLHVYHYSNNNPIRYLDPDGRAAGDLFDTMDAAAEDFGKTYNDDSIRNNVEYGTTLYKNKDGKYYYSVPNMVIMKAL